MDLWPPSIAWKSSSVWICMKMHISSLLPEGYRMPQLLEQRIEESKGGGPGTYEIPTFLDVLFTRSHCISRDVGFTQEKRFKSPPRKKVLPGPGTYKYRDDGLMKHQWTPVCPFEWDGFVERGIRFRKSWELPPNRYNYIEQNSITGKVNKKVSERGPYDIFTGPRDESTIKNHFAPSAFKGAKNWLRSLPSELDRLKKNPQYGRWRKITQSGKYQSNLQEGSSTNIHRTATFPGPADYCPIGVHKYRPKPVILYPFGSSVANARPRLKFKLSPGPGRYSIKPKMPCHGHRRPEPI
ncbi:ciliary microtubule-associated protein 2 [Anabrus simplex]|uniref:ciliary microtubule-associated protein 2 n=1 Tax=Anabrus simplex TaxID=316456 RepID=UPI0035A32198